MAVLHSFVIGTVTRRLVDPMAQEFEIFGSKLALLGITLQVVVHEDLKNFSH
jgi:hypothetical protein